MHLVTVALDGIKYHTSSLVSVSFGHSIIFSETGIEKQRMRCYLMFVLQYKN